MNKFVRSLITEWRRIALPVSGEAVVIAVSGGADSSALLAALVDLRERRKLDLRFIAAHLNHGLRGDASLADEHFVEKLASDLEVEFVTSSARIQKRGNLEQNARKVRYEFLTKTAASFGAKLIVTGHTMNDQAETFLLNLIRGSGADGLSAMRPVRWMDEKAAASDEGVRLARPLLRWAKREDTVSFCNEMSIEFRSDEMNDDTTFSRVRVRKIVIPMLKEFNPKIIDTLCKTSQHFAEMSSPAIEATDTLPVAELRVLPDGDMARTLRSWLASKRGTLRGIDTKHIEALQRLVLSRKSGKTVELPGRQTVTKRGGRLVFDSIMVEK
jgi:tRNA(Ile)-lysidine synthase